MPIFQKQQSLNKLSTLSKSKICGVCYVETLLFLRFAKRALKILKASQRLEK